MAPIQPPAPEPVQSPYNTGAGGGANEQQMQQQQRQQQRQQAAVDPYATAPGRAEESPYASAGLAGDASGGSRFKKMLDMGAKASQGNSAKEKLKAYLLSRYAPDDMSPQAVAYRRLISGAESGFVGAEVKDEYMEGLKKGAKQKAAELYKRTCGGVPAGAGGACLSVLWVSSCSSLSCISHWHPSSYPPTTTTKPPNHHQQASASPSPPRHPSWAQQAAAAAAAGTPPPAAATMGPTGAWRCSRSPPPPWAGG